MAYDLVFGPRDVYTSSSSVFYSQTTSSLIRATRQSSEFDNSHIAVPHATGSST